MKTNKIYNENCLDTMAKMPDNFIDLTVTSPPYNVDLGNNKFNKNPYNLYNDNKDHCEYISWIRDIFKEVHTKTKSGGRCVINIGDGKNGGVPTHSDIIQLMTQDIGWLPITTIIWNKNQVAGRTAWGSFQSPASPSFPTPFEYIMVFAKEHKKLQYKGESDLGKENFIKWAYGIWNMAPETRMKDFGHPAMFPEELVRRCLEMFSWKNSLVYDPFMGSGTTAKMAIIQNRNFIGSEISKEYCEIAEQRIKSEQNNLFNSVK